MNQPDEKAVAGCYLFRSVPADEIREAIRSLRVTVADFPADADIFTPRTFSRALVIIIDGEAEVFRETGGKKVLMNVLGPGDVFGAASLFADRVTYPTRVRAKTEMRIASVSERDLKALFAQYPKTALNHIAFLTDRIRFLNDRILDLTGRSAESKVARYLSAEYGKGTFQTSLSMTKLAVSLDIGRASLYRVLQKMRDMGYIAIEDKEIRVLAPEELERISESI